MTDEAYYWQGKRLFNWYSKEARVIRAYLILEARYDWMDEYFHKAIDLRDGALPVQAGIEIDITDAFLVRMHRFKRAACRLRDRLGCSNIAASDAFNERHPLLPGEDPGTYYERMREIGAR